MFKMLKPLGEEYYYFYMHPNQPAKAMTLRTFKWVLWYFVLFAGFMQLGMGFSMPPEESPKYGLVAMVSTLMLILTLSYCIPVLIVTPGKLLIKHYQLSVIILWFGAVLFQTTVIYIFTAVFILANENPETYVVLSLGTIVLAVCMNIWMLFYGCRRIAAGAFKENGSGFFNIKDKSKREKILRILGMVGTAAAPWPFALYSWSHAYNHRLIRQYREPLSPFAQEIVIPIFCLFISFVMITGCAALTYRLFVMLHMYRKFGYQQALIKPPTKTPKPNKEKWTRL